VALPPPNSPGGCPLRTFVNMFECANQLDLDSFDFNPFDGGGLMMCTSLKLYDSCLRGFSRACYVSAAGACSCHFTRRCCCAGRHLPCPCLRRIVRVLGRYRLRRCCVCCTRQWPCFAPTHMHMRVCAVCSCASAAPDGVCR
jgi:hypothetical protein